MAIGTAALIGGAVGIGGALLSSGAQKSAAKSASKTAEQNSAANNAMTREIYGSNKAMLSPFANNGLQASNALNAMLLGTPVAQEPVQGTQQYGAPVPLGQDGMIGQDNGARFNLDAGFGPMAQWARSRMIQQQNPLVAAQPAPAVAQPMSQGVPAGNPWDQFRNSTNYQFRLDQGNKALNQGYAARGVLESGEALKGFADYNQNFAANELGNYQQLLAGQQNMGLGAASAVAGVGQNMVNNVTANNNSAAQVAAQAALMKGSANANMFSSIAGSLGGLFGSSYGR